MRLVRNAAVLLALLLTALATVYFGFMKSEIVEGRYATWEEARESSRGWLPADMSASATEIHEWHDLDTNATLGSFRFDPEDRFLRDSARQPEFPSNLRIDRDPSFASPVPRDPTADQLEDLGFAAYLDSDVGYAVDWTGGVAYYWSGP